MTASYEFYEFFLLVRNYTYQFSRHWLEGNENENVTRDRIELHLWMANHLVIIPTFRDWISRRLRPSSGRIISYERQLSHIPRRCLRHRRRPIYHVCAEFGPVLFRQRAPRAASTREERRRHFITGSLRLEINRRTPKRARSSIPYRSKVPGRRAFLVSRTVSTCANSTIDRRILPIGSSRSRVNRSYRSESFHEASIVERNSNDYLTDVQSYFLRHKIIHKNL